MFVTLSLLLAYFYIDYKRSAISQFIRRSKILSTLF